MRPRTFALSLLFISLQSAAIAATDDAAQKGLEIATEADRRDSGWVDQRAELRMLLRNKHGEASARVLRISTLEVAGDGDKSLIVFHSPRDIAGTAFLSYTHALKPDEQWLYLPALKRVKRIASANKSGPFVGSEFAYEDLTSQELEKYHYKWLRDEACGAHQCFVIERRPAYKNSGYTRQIVWIDQTIYQHRRIEFYDRKNALLKTLTSSDYEQYLERYWRPARMKMENHQTGKSTLLTWQNYRFGNGFGAREFDQNTLKRSR